MSVKVPLVAVAQRQHSTHAQNLSKSWWLRLIVSTGFIFQKETRANISLRRASSASCSPSRGSKATRGSEFWILSRLVTPNSESCCLNMRPSPPCHKHPVGEEQHASGMCACIVCLNAHICGVDGLIELARSLLSRAIHQCKVACLPAAVGREGLEKF